MLWVIQEDMFIENRRPELIRTLERLDVPHVVVRMTKDGLHPEISHNGAIITNGSVALSALAVARGWSPGSLMGDNFSYPVWYPRFRDHLLNRDAIFSTLGEAEPQWDRFFIRPVSDDKSFNGQIVTRSEFSTWRESLGVDFLTEILHAPPRTIGQEIRHYVVDGRVVTSSRYRLGGKINYSEQVDQSTIDFANDMARIWQPARAFVLDTYVSGSEQGIVEMGCICNAGLYACDLQRFVIALNDLEN